MAHQLAAKHRFAKHTTYTQRDAEYFEQKDAPCASPRLKWRLAKAPPASCPHTCQGEVLGSGAATALAERLQLSSSPSAGPGPLRARAPPTHTQAVPGDGGVCVCRGGCVNLKGTQGTVCGGTHLITFFCFLLEGLFVPLTPEIVAILRRLRHAQPCKLKKRRNIYELHLRVL